METQTQNTSVVELSTNEKMLMIAAMTQEYGEINREVGAAMQVGMEPQQAMQAKMTLQAVLSSTLGFVQLSLSQSSFEFSEAEMLRWHLALEERAQGVTEMQEQLAKQGQLDESGSFAKAKEEIETLQNKFKFDGIEEKINAEKQKQTQEEPSIIIP